MSKLMRKRIVLLVTLGIAMFAVQCCKKDPTTPTKPLYIFNKSDFPLAVGYWWKYRVTDHQGGDDDTITVRINSQEIVGSETHYEFDVRRNNGAIVDSGYYVSEDDRILYKSKHPGYPFFGNTFYSFPMQDSSSWVASSPSDNVYVVGIADSIKFYSNVFKPVFFLQRNHKQGTTYQYLQTTQLCPKVGVIYASIYYYDLYPRQSQNYVLLDYMVN
jgi:hypothetical protein